MMGFGTVGRSFSVLLCRLRLLPVKTIDLLLVLVLVLVLVPLLAYFYFQLSIAGFRRQRNGEPIISLLLFIWLTNMHLPYTLMD